MLDACVHWLYWAYDSKDAKGDMKNVVSIEVVAASEGDALKSARDRYQPTGAKSGYLLRSVIEHRGDCHGSAVK